MPQAEPGLFPVSIVAGAGAAVLGGLLWAGVVIVSGYDIGILAGLVGAATGLAMVRITDRPVSTAGRAIAGVFAAAAIMFGKYVIFVHAVKAAYGAQFAAQGDPTGYLDTRQMSIFVHNLGSIVRPWYILWVAFAVFAAVRTAGGKSVLRRRR